MEFIQETVYAPAEDSYFMTEFLKEHLGNMNAEELKDLRYCDMGTGSGILSEAAGKYLDKKHIIAVDVNEKAVEFVKKKEFEALQSNLFERVAGSFDLITFNAPYLPRDEREPVASQLATTGGKRGDELAVRFVQDAKTRINENGKIFLLMSTLSPLTELEKLGGKIIQRKKIFMEELVIMEFS